MIRYSPEKYSVYFRDILYTVRRI